jgi:hypothetical protein
LLQSARRRQHAVRSSQLAPRSIDHASSSDTASIEASCNAAIAKKFLTDILANGPVVPPAPRSTDPDVAGSTTQPPFPSSLNPLGTVVKVCFFGNALTISNVDMSDSESTLEVFSRRFAPWLSSAGCDVSLIDDFVRMRRYRERASEFELLAENEPLSEVRFRYRIVARHYRELADRDERNDQEKMAECLEMLKLARREAAE